MSQGCRAESGKDLGMEGIVGMEADAVWAGAPDGRKRKSWSPSEAPGGQQLPPIASFFADSTGYQVQTATSNPGFASPQMGPSRSQHESPWLDTWAASIHHTRPSISPTANVRPPIIPLPSVSSHVRPPSSSSNYVALPISGASQSHHGAVRCSHSVDSQHTHRREPFYEPPNGGALYPLPSGLDGSGAGPSRRQDQHPGHHQKHHSTYLRDSGIVSDDDRTPTRERPYFVSPDSHYQPPPLPSMYTSQAPSYPPIKSDITSAPKASTSYESRPRKFSSASMEEYRTIPGWKPSEVVGSSARTGRVKPAVPLFMSTREGFQNSGSSSDSLPSLAGHAAPPRLKIGNSSSSSLSSLSDRAGSAFSSRLDLDAEHARTPDVTSLQIGPSQSHSYFPQPSSSTLDDRAVRHQSVTGSDSSDSSAPTSSENGGWTTTVPPVLPAQPWADQPGDTWSQGTLKYACSHCPKRFARPSSLRIHLNSHTGDKPFDCDVCGRSFSVQSNLRRHLKIHRKQGLKTSITASSDPTVEEKSTSEEGESPSDPSDHSEDAIGIE